MATEVGSVELGVKLNDNLEKDVAKVANKADSILTGRFNAIGATIGKVLAITALARFGSQCIQLGSDLAEVQNVVDVTFPTMSKRVDEFARNAITSIGMSQKVAKEYMGQLGSMAQAFGYGEAASYDMASAITTLTGDVASFYNLSNDEAFTKLKSVFTGETESLKSLGVVMTQSALDEYALANGFGKTTAKMSEQEKVALRLAFVQNALSNAAGDFERTSDGWANSTRVLSLRFEELKATIGQGLINVLTPIIGVINVILGGLQTLANYFVAFTRLLTGGKGAAGATGAIASNIGKAGAAAGGLTSGLGKAGKAADKLKGALAGFDDLNVLHDSEDSDSGGGGGAGGGGADFGSLGIPDGSIDMSGVDEIYNRVKGVFDKVTGFLKDHKVIITSLLGGMFAGFATFGIIKNWSAIKGVFTGLLAPLKSLATGFSTFFTGIANGEGVLTSLQAVFGTATGTALFFAAIVAAVSAALIYLYQTSSDFRALVQTALDSLLGILSNLWNNVLVPLGAFLLDVFNTVIVPIATFLAEVFVKAVDVLFSGLLSLWNNVLAPIANFLVTVLSIALKTIVDVWNGWKPAIEAIGEGVAWVWNNILSPLADFIKGAMLDAFAVLGKFVDELLKSATSMFKGFSDFLIGIFTLDVDKAMQGVQEILRTFLGFLDRVFGTNFSSSFKFINGIVMAFFSGTQQIFDGIKRIFGGLINFIQGIFTGNWKQAWQGIVDIFGGIFSTISGVVKGPINAVIAIVNGAINRINGVGFTVPDWVPIIGGKGFRVDLPNIPALAQGGYVGANAPRLALIGDNRHEGEIVSPESKIYEQTKRAIDDALMASQGGNGQEVIIQLMYEILETLQNLGIVIDRDKLLKLIDQRNKQLQLAKGG